MSVTDVARRGCDHPSFDRETVDRLRRAFPSRERLSDAERRLGALSNRTRLLIVHALAEGDELCVCDVAHLLGCSVAKASHHLGKLRAAEIVTFRNDGRMAYYRLSDPRAKALVQTSLGTMSAGGARVTGIASG